MLSDRIYIMKTLWIGQNLDTRPPQLRRGGGSNRLSHGAAHLHYESWNTLLDAA